MMQTETPNIQDYTKQKQFFTLPVSASVSSQHETSHDYFNFYPGYKGIDLSQSHRKIIQSITTLFESWQTWQRHILLSGLIHRFNKTQLKNLKTAVESLCHRDFIAIYKKAYPMHQIKERQLVHYSELFKSDHKSRQALSALGFVSEDEKVFESLNSKLKLKHKQLSTEKKNALRYLRCGKSDAWTAHERAQTTPAISHGIPLKNKPKAIVVAKPFKKKAVERDSSMISLPSVWRMGEDKKLSEENESDFESRVSPVDRSPDDYFPCISSHPVKGKFVTTSSKIGLENYMTRYHTDRNKTPWPTAPQLYKNQKLWSSHHHTVDTTALRLKELFQKQMNQIWKWIGGWEEHRRMRLLLHLLSISITQDQKFVADCIKDKIREIRGEESLAVNFPQRVWMKIIDFLDRIDVEKSELVCKRWNVILTNEDLWIKKCKEIGEKLKITDFEQLIRSACSDNETPNWRHLYFALRDLIRQRLFDEDAGLESILADDVLNCFQTVKVMEGDIDSLPDLFLPSKKIIHQREEKRKAFFSEFKSQLKARSEEEREKARLMLLEEKKRRTEEAERRRRELEKKRREQIAKIMYVVKQADIKEKDDKRKKKVLTQKTFIEVFDTLLTEEELSSAARTIKFFAVDHTEGDTQGNKPWISDNYVPPITNVVALQGHVRPVWCVLVHGCRVISGGLDRKIRFWTIAGDCFATVDEVAKGGIRSMAIGTHERCRTLYASSWDETIRVVDCITLKTSAVLIGHKDTVSGIAVDNNYVVSCSFDCTMRVWDVKDNKMLRVIKHHDKPIFCLTLKNGLIFSGGSDWLLHVTEAQTGDLLKTYIGHSSPITAVKVRKNLIVSADLEGFLFFWSLRSSEKPVSTLRAHKKRINALAFSDQRLFTASDDKQVKEWNLFTLKCLRIMQGHSRPVMDVKITRDCVVTCSKDGTVRMWWWLKYKEGEKMKEKKILAPTET